MLYPMLYFATSSVKIVKDAMRTGVVGYITTPRGGHRPEPEMTWCADTGCFGDNYVGDEAWISWLSQLAVDCLHNCAFATAPDVVGDAEATLARSLPWLPRIRELGFPAAFVAQDGQEYLPVPWDEFDVLFLGGAKTKRSVDEWKLSSAAGVLASEARARGKFVHMGRVNSKARILIAMSAPFKCDFVDGTYMKFGPNINLPRMLRFIAEVERELAESVD